MNRRRLRNTLMLAAAAVSASLEAPRVAQQSLHAAAVELADAHAAVATAVQQVASSVTESHLGFDTNIYPGAKAMAAWKRFGKYEWVGYYLEAPCHKDDSWSGKRTALTDSGWGLAVIYVGQQTWGKKLSGKKATTSLAAAKKAHTSKSRRTRTMRRESKKPVATSGKNCSADFVGAAQGRIDARDAVAKTAKEGFPKGSVVFLDVEYMDVLPQRMRDYYQAWTAAVLEDGRYRAGIYAHTHNAKTIYDDVSDVYAAEGIKADPPFWIAGKGDDFDIDRPPTGVGHQFASAWQGMLDVVRTHNGVKLPIDISVASVASPSLTQ